MGVSVRSTSSRSQQRLFHQGSIAALEVLSLAQGNVQSTGILRTDLRFRKAESWRLV